MLNPFSKEYKEAVKKLGRDYKTVYNESAKAYDEALRAPKPEIVGNCLRITDKNGREFKYPISQVKLFEITNDQISIIIGEHFIPKIKTFFFDEKDKEAYERIADALPSDIWYRDESATTHVAAYKNEKDANKEAGLAAKKGWMPQGSSTTDGNFNVGAGLGAAFLLGPIGLLAAANKTGGKINVTYVRTPEWLAAYKSN